METDRFDEISIETEMKRSYLDYAMSVIIGRALPEIRDGLKPVHRRVLYAMYEQKNDWNKPYRKSSKVVGDVMSNYHPHGDSAIYDTIVRLAQDFSMRYPLVDGQGNFGSMDGDPPAAMRYTEVRLTKLAHEMLQDIEKETVNFLPNYDETTVEPTVLPTRFPCLLVNGSSGIAVGMATNIPPHNLGEVVDALIALIDNPDLSWRELMQIIPGPDFPTGGTIYGVKGIMEAYSRGKGIIRVRAKTGVEEDSKTGQETIVVTELPYQVNKARLVEKIADLSKNKVIEGIRFIRDESDRKGMRIAIGLKKDQFPDVILNQLFKHTQMENSFGIIFLAVANRRPELFGLKELLQHFIQHRKEVIIRRTRYELRKAEERAHILEGYRIALDNIDPVVALIKASPSPKEAKNALMENYGLTDVQAQAILEMRLQRLTGLERDKIIEEYEGLLKDIERYKAILGDDSLVFNLIREELTAVRDEYGDARRTRIVEQEKEVTIEDMIADEDMVVTITRSGYIKRSPITFYQSQRRGGRGKTAMTTRDEDVVALMFVASAHHTFLFFTNTGKVYWSKVYEIPQASRTGKGKAIVNFLNFDKDEKLTTVLNVPAFEPGSYILMTTKSGIIKKTELMAFSRPKSGGIIAISLRQDDELVAARITDGSQNVFLCSKTGQSIRFHESDIRPTGRNSQGVIGMRFIKEDEIVGMEVLSHSQTLFTVTENGYGKRTTIDEYPLHKRGGKGVITIKTTPRNGNVVAILLVKDTDDLLLMTDSGKLIRTGVDTISVISRNTQGVKVMNLEPDERITGAARIEEMEKRLSDSEDKSDEEPEEPGDFPH